jgi:tetratricopeptide (TPR) repeat protein
MNTKLLSTIVVLAAILFNCNLFAQDEDDESCIEPSKSAMKLLKIAENTKNEKMERIKAYTDALKEVPDNAYVYFSFANYNFGLAEEIQEKFDNGRANFNQLNSAYEGAANTYKKVIQFCPEFHSDAYYKCGFIYYLLGDKGQASKYFKTFIEFKSNDPNAFSED